MRRHITFIGAASSWGAAYRGPEQAPMALWAGGLAESLQRPNCHVDWHGVIETESAPPKHDLKLYEAYDSVVQIVSGLAREVENVMAAQPLTTPVIIGGDHSVAMGTWSGVVNALNAHKKFGLLWVDAHMDSHTPITCSQGKWGGHLHGMPLAHLLGLGDKKLCEIGSKKTKLDPRYICLVGVRSFEPAEEELLKRLGITYFTSKDVQKQGIDAVMKQALEIVSKAPMGWGFSLDLDVFDPKDMPCVGTPEKNGVDLQSFLQNLSALKLPSFPKAIEIVEYMPGKDPEGLGIKAVEQFLWLLFKK
jgi:arginase